MKRELPTINIEGTEFLVDINKLELREKANEKNVISFKDMTDFGKGYSFEYNLKIRNIPHRIERSDIEIKIPEFVALDPVGMAQKYGLSEEEVKTKTDFEVMVDQKAYDKRVNKGMLPTIDIVGHTFYVDIRMDKLRPKDDFLSKGIVFSEIGGYYDDDDRAYTIPYNPSKHEFQEIDYKTLKELPKDLIAIEIPFERILDRIGWNRKYGLEPTHGLKQVNLQVHFKSKIIPWQQTFLPELIKRNIESDLRINKPDISTKKQHEGKKGRKL
jgi:hypothetical protein